MTGMACAATFLTSPKTMFNVRQHVSKTQTSRLNYEQSKYVNDTSVTSTHSSLLLGWHLTLTTLKSTTLSM